MACPNEHQDNDKQQDSNALEADAQTGLGGRIKILSSSLKNNKFKLLGAVIAALLVLLVIVYLVYPRPDFEVKAFAMPDEVVSGDEMVITADVENIGRARGAYSVTLFFDDDEVEVTDIMLDAGGKDSLEFSVPVDYSPGTYPVYLGLGPEKDYFEELASSVEVLNPFTVEGFEVPEEVFYGEDLLIAIGVENISSSQAPYSVTLFVDDNEVEATDIMLDAGEKEVLEFSVPVDYSPGTYPVHLGLGPEKDYCEDLASSLEVLNPYVVEDFDVPEEIAYGANLLISAAVENISATETPYNATLFIDGDEVETKEIMLGGGEKEVLEFSTPVDYSSGSYPVALELGPEETSFEKLEGSLQVYRPAEFVVENLSLTSRTVDVGDDVVARVSVTNVGDVQGSHTVSLTLNGTVIDSQEVSLDGGSQTELSFPLTINNPGSHTVAVGGLNTSVTAYQIERPANGTVLVNKISGGDGELKITNNRSVDSLVVLSDPGKPKEPLMAVYLRAASSTTVRSIRDGTYEIYYSFGSQWDAHSRKFTQNAEYGRFEEEKKFETTRRADYIEYSIWELEFYVLDADMPARTRTIPADQFPSW